LLATGFYDRVHVEDLSVMLRAFKPAAAHAGHLRIAQSL